jgi:hypothetical protein
MNDSSKLPMPLSQHKKLVKKKIISIMLRILLLILILELVFNLSGIVIGSIQEYRNRIIVQSKDKIYTIMVIGDSMSASIPSGEDWPNILGGKLNSASNTTKFKVINKAIAGVPSGYIVSEIENNIKKYEPDIIISLMGATDSDEYYNKGNNIVFYIEKMKIYKLIISFFASQSREDNLDEGFKRLETLGNTYMCGQLMNAEINESLINSTLVRAIQNESWKRLNLPEIENSDKALAYDSYAYSIGNLSVESKVSLLKKAEKIYLKDLMPSQFNHGACLNIGVFYIKVGCYDLSSKYFKKAYMIDESTKPFIEITIAKATNYNKGYNDIVFRNDSLNGMNSAEFNYLALYDILSEKKIKLFAMQYPTLDIGMLKMMLNKTNDVVYISNVEYFNDASRYKELYSDQIGAFISNHIFIGKWGHLSQAGHALVAENAAKAILEELNITAQ